MNTRTFLGGFSAGKNNYSKILQSLHDSLFILQQFGSSNKEKPKNSDINTKKNCTGTGTKLCDIDKQNAKIKSKNSLMTTQKSPPTTQRISSLKQK